MAATPPPATQSAAPSVPQRSSVLARRPETGGIRYHDKRLFAIGTGYACITVQARRASPFAVVDMLHHAPIPKEEADAKASDPKPDADEADPHRQGDSGGADSGATDGGGAATDGPPPAGEAPTPVGVEEPPVAADAPATDVPAMPKEDGAPTEDTAAAAAAAAAADEAEKRRETPVKEKKPRDIFGRLDAPVTAQLVDAMKRRAFLPCIGGGKWTLAIAVPCTAVPGEIYARPADPDTSAPRSEPPPSAPQSVQPPPHAGKAFFMGPRVSNVSGAPTPSNEPFSSSSEDDEDDGDEKETDPVKVFAEGLRARIPGHFELFVFDVDVPLGPFVGDNASASCISAAMIGNFKSSTADADRCFTWCAMEWALLRFTSRSIPPDIWALLWRQSQTIFPKTDKTNASIATRPGLMCSPNPKLRFCFDLRPKTTMPATSYLETGYVLQGRNQDGTRTLPDGSRTAPLSSNARRKWKKDVANRRDALTRVRITVNRDFRGTLHRMREYHLTKKSGTWFDPDYIEYLAEMQETDSVNEQAWRDIMRHQMAMPSPTAPLPPSPTLADVKEQFDGGSDAETDDGWDGVEPGSFAAPQPTASSENSQEAGLDAVSDAANCSSSDADSITPASKSAGSGMQGDGEGAGDNPEKSTGPSDRSLLAALMDLQDRSRFGREVLAFNDDLNARRRLSRRLVRLYTVELWDADTDEPLASTFGFQVGRAFHDCSMATFVRTRAQMGHLLTHAVADLLQRASVELWYWGAELPYMSEYRKTAGAFDIPIGRFLPLWRAIASKAPKRNVTLERVVDALPGCDAMPPWRRRRAGAPPDTKPKAEEKKVPPPPPAAAAEADPATTSAPEEEPREPTPVVSPRESQPSSGRGAPAHALLLPA